MLAVEGGGSLINFIRLGFPPENMVGIDIQKERIEEAKRRFPNIKFVHGDASKMQFNDESFDIVTESTMFVQITDDGLATSIANEMIRVTKIWGYIILVDWRYSKPWNKSYKRMSQRRIKTLFDVGVKTEIIKTFKGALIPLVGRFLSKRLSPFYFIVSSFFPVLCGQIATILRRVK